jgi:hypothetical protein
MKPLLKLHLALIFIILSLSSSLSAQPWTFIKERDGVRLYTCQQEGTSFKSFHGEVDFKGDFEKLCSLVGDPSNLDWWADNVKSIQVLYFEKNKKIGYYFEYHVPWPFANRDLVTGVQINKDSITGIKTIYSSPLPGVVPINHGLVRVTDYWQKWTLQPLGNGKIHVTLEGFIDPAGDVPAWLYNIVVVDIPLKLLQEVRKKAAE